MATKILYKYEVSPNELFLIENSSKVYLERNGVCDVFICNSKDRTLHNLTEIEDLKIEDAFKSSKIFVETSIKFSKETISETIQFDWSQTITDLEEKNLVKTKTTRSFMAADTRKYWIDDEKNAIDVDCLGTPLFFDESEIIINMWKSSYLSDTIEI